MLAASLLTLPLFLGPARVPAPSPEAEIEAEAEAEPTPMPIYIFLPEDVLEHELDLALRTTCPSHWSSSHWIPRTGPQVLIRIRLDFTATMLRQARGVSG